MDKIDQNKNIMLGQKVWAVIGVTPNQQKFGYKIWKKLRQENYEVYPVNPKYTDVEGEKCYRALKELPQRPDVVNFVVPPQVSLKALDEAKELGIKYLWFQPGTAGEEVINSAEDMGFEIVFHDCVLVALE
ncbi:CoA-binding protein [Brassicibacter mesophilus]|uniref:CoA-binding protein n=1 Tax=Brassicibacter mesophilus TaxID=745119 RepID=UPI003D194B5B